MREVQERDVNDYMYETAEQTEISLFRLIYHLFQKEHIITRNSGRTTMSATLLNVKLYQMRVRLLVTYNPYPICTQATDKSMNEDETEIKRARVKD